MISFLACSFDEDSVSFQVNNVGLDFFNSLDCSEKEDFMDAVLKIVAYMQDSATELIQRELALIVL